MDSIYLGTHTGEVFTLNYNTKELNSLFSTEDDNECITCIEKLNDKIYILSPYKIYEIDLNIYQVTNMCESIDSFPFFMSMKIKDDIIYVVSGKNSILYLVDMDFYLMDKKKEFPVFKMNNETRFFAFSNDVFLRDDKIYVNFGPVESYKDTFSGVIGLDRDLERIEKINYGWNSVRFSVIDDKYWALCNRLDDKFVSCLLIDNSITAKFDNNFELYDFDVCDDKICISGHYRSTKDGIFNSCGFLAIFTRDFKNKKYFSFKDTGAITSCKFV